jgi:hypothetical protein
MTSAIANSIRFPTKTNSVLLYNQLQNDIKPPILMFKGKQRSPKNEPTKDSSRKTTKI